MKVQDLLAQASAAVPTIDPVQARKMIADQNALVVDVRDAHEVEKTGKIRDAVHVSRGMLEFKACPSSAAHDERFDKERPVLLYCASGGRSALAGKTLKDMGFTVVYNLGGFKTCVDAGFETEPGR